MHLQRIQVPDFRVLKDVDITFEKEFVPSIFPLGSLNGGGKSTLLQLIFVLLHCSVDSNRKKFLKNMINGFQIYKSVDKRVLAIIDIWDGEKIVKINFFSYKDFYIRDLLIQEGENETSDEDGDYQYLRFSTLERVEYIEYQLLIKEIEVSEIEKIFDKVKQESIYQGLIIAKAEVKELENEYNKLEAYSKKISHHLQSKNLIYICNYSISENDDEHEVLLCQVDNVDIDKAESFLKKLSQKVFLAAPATQVFLFLPKECRKLLFKNQSYEKNEINDNNNYYSELQVAKSKLSSFFAYDFLAVDLLIESFKAARDRDFREAIETGEYGNNYKELINDLNTMLINKKLNINIDLSGVNFNLIRDGESIELQPEDLSHGELKRFGIYMWIKSRNIENAIVLMDEVEIAFHPDWQYQIVSDLQQWAPSNQYILATHSYELCQALTPSHVKELEPKLVKKQEA
jgi:predicted ATP-dependent endonuclease of OLD family